VDLRKREVDVRKEARVNVSDVKLAPFSVLDPIREVADNFARLGRGFEFFRSRRVLGRLRWRRVLRAAGRSVGARSTRAEEAAAEHGTEPAPGAYMGVEHRRLFTTRRGA